MDGQGILWNWQNLPHSFFLFLVVLRLVVACSTPRYGGNEYAALRLIRNRENPHAQMGRHGSEKPASKVKLCNSRKCRNLWGKTQKVQLKIQLNIAIFSLRITTSCRYGHDRSYILCPFLLLKLDTKRRNTHKRYIFKVFLFTLCATKEVIISVLPP